MDAGQIDELRRWGQNLSEDGSHPELQPAGRAILLLIDEIERLREQTRPDEPPSEDGDGRPETAPGPEPGPRPTRTPQKRDFFHRYRRLAVGLAVLGALVFTTLALGARLSAPGLDPQGPAANAAVGPAKLPSLSFSVGADQSVLDRVHWKLDGTDVTGKAYMKGGRFVLDGNRLRDGNHRIQATAPGGFPGSRTTKSWNVRVDTHGPTISFDRPGVMIPYGHPVALGGTLEPGATLTANGRPVLVSSNGRFRLSWAKRPTGPISLVATDTLRNTSARRVWISMQPRRPTHPVRAVHVTADAWADPALHKGIVDLIDQGRINAVELDLKDESGTVGWNAPVPLAHRSGAVKPIVDLPAAVEFLHAKGVRVIGRLVCFRDPILAGAAWRAGRRAEVIQTPDGQMYGGYGGFTNFANPAVRRYQIAIAVAAAKAGVDDVLYDYVRRPDGPLSTMVFPGLKGTPGAVDRLFPGRDPGCAEALRDVPRRVGLRRGGHATDGGRPEHPDDGLPRRLHLGDGLSLALGGRASTAWPTRTRSRTTSSSVRSRTSSATSEAPAPASFRGSRTSRSGSITAPPRSRRRSAAPTTPASTSTCSGTRR